MPILINGEKIADKFIQDEINKMRPDYQKMFTDQSREEQEKQLLEWAKENVTEKTLIKQYAVKNNREDITKEVEEEFAKFRKQFDSEEKYHEALKKNNETEANLRKGIEEQARVNRTIKNLTKDAEPVTEQQAKNYYKAQKTEFTVPEQIHVKHLVKHIDYSTNEDEIKKLMQKAEKEIQSGEDFETIANKYSDCAGGGIDLGYFPRGQMVHRFEDIVFAMKKGQVSSIFKTEFGYHIAKVIDKKPSQVLSFDKTKTQIIEKLNKENENKKLENFVDALKVKADVKYIAPPKTERKKGNGKPLHMKKILASILIKPAGPDCNMACEYCFYLKKQELFNKSKKHRMSEETLEEMIRQTLKNSNRQISFGWQGGEPTLMGLPFFEKAVELQKKYSRDHVIGNGLQTNGILIDEKWAKFLADNKFLVGLSLDGQEHIHNKYRFLKNGKGSLEKVVNAAKLLLNSNVAVNSLSVVNDYSVNFPEETYNYLKSLGFNFMQFIPIVETDPKNPKLAAPFSVTAEKFGEFLCKIFDLWQADFIDGRPQTSVRLFDSLFHKYVGYPVPECVLMKECGIYVVVEHNGEVYSCDFFVEPEWKLGDIKNDDLHELLNSDKQNRFGKIKSTLPDVCKKCKWLNLCRGGCPKDRIKDSRDNNVSHFCEAYKMLYEHGDARFRKMAANWLEEEKKAKAAQAQQQAAMAAQTQQSVAGAQNKIGRNDPCPCGSGKKFKKCCGKS